MTQATESQLVTLIQEQAESTARVANELELLNERMLELERIAREQSSLLARLVVLQEERDRREAAAAALEATRVQAELDERRARGAWLRELLSARVLVPVLTGLGTAITAIGAWLHSLWAGQHR